MPDPFADLGNMLSQNATKLTEILKVPFTVPLSVGGALIETGKTMTRGGQIPTPQDLLKQTSLLMEQASPLKLLQKGGEIVGEERATGTGGKNTRTTIF
jgi:hypothetical protein